jgi:foldase protein PrsA
MLKFFRNNAAVFGWGIVAIFVITMFAGAMLMDSGTTTAQTETPKENWAYIGDIPVDQTRFKEILTRSFAPYAQNGGLELDPQMVEILQYSALMQAVQYTVFHEGAMSAKIKPSKQDMEAALQQVYIQYDIKDKAALKKTLKENNYPYETFLESLKTDILTQKFITHLQDSITLTNQDVDNAYVQIRLQHALFKPSANATEDNENKAKQAATDLGKGATFETIVGKTTTDPAIISSGGDIGWVGIGMLPRDLEKAAFSLGKGEWTQPIRSHYGYHIVKLTDRRELQKPASINYEAEKEQLMPKYRQAAVENYIQAFLERYPLEVKDPLLAAYYYKSRGDMDGAVNAYQAQISQSPYDPKPHYLLAQLYSGYDISKSIEEIKKAKIKIDIAPSLDFAALHLLDGDLLRQSGQAPAANDAYDKAITLAQNQASTLGYMEAFFKERQDKTRESRVAKLKEAIEAKAALKAEADKAQENTAPVALPK